MAALRREVRDCYLFHSWHRSWLLNGTEEGVWILLLAFIFDLGLAEEREGKGMNVCNALLACGVYIEDSNVVKA